MTKKELIDYCFGRLSGISGGTSHDEQYRACYYDCLGKTKENGYSERAFVDIWYNAMLWYNAVHKTAASGIAS